jgi:hypothetical protein
MATLRGSRVGPLASIAAALAVAVAGLVASPAPSSTGALFTAVEGATGGFAADTLEPPSGIGVVGGASAILAWTPTVDAYAEGYVIERATAIGGPYSIVGTATPVSALGHVDSPTTDGTYWYRVRTWASSWQSPPAGPLSAAILAGVTGFRPCTAQAPEAGGDDDGYEGSPADGCSIDDAVATDGHSGRGTSTSCTSDVKDKHRFSAFALGVPATASAITGITVRYRAGIDSTAATNRICVQLSWNDGTSWTAAQLAPFATTELATYTLGGPLFLWGRAWTAAELSDATFHVRLIDVSSKPNRDFSLDGVEVQVDYTP